jgi:hypothetical protein
MINEKKTVAAIFFALNVAACSSHPEPIIDMKGVDPVAMRADRDECEAYAEQVIVAAGTARGAAAGAVVGAATGAISGNADSGAGYGAIWGATRSGVQGSKEQEQVFKRCMRGRGYQVLN